MKGVSEIRLYRCDICSEQYPNEQQAVDCFSKGLPKLLPPGEKYQRGNDFFTIQNKAESFGPSVRTHELHYIVQCSDPSFDSGFEFVMATASFDGSRLHSIRGIHPRGGFESCGEEEASRVS